MSRSLIFCQSVYQYGIRFVMQKYQFWITCIILGYDRAHFNYFEIRLSSSGSKYVNIKSRIQRRFNWALSIRSRIGCGPSLDWILETHVGPGLDSTFESFRGLRISLLKSHRSGFHGLGLLGLILADPWPNSYPLISLSEWLWKLHVSKKWISPRNFGFLKNLIQNCLGLGVDMKQLRVK